MNVYMDLFGQAPAFNWESSVDILIERIIQVYMENQYQLICFEFYRKRQALCILPVFNHRLEVRTIRFWSTSWTYTVEPHESYSHELSISVAMCKHYIYYKLTCRQHPKYKQECLPACSNKTSSPPGCWNIIYIHLCINKLIVYSVSQLSTAKILKCFHASCYLHVSKI